MSLPSDSGYGSTLFGTTRQSQTKDRYTRPHIHSNDHFIRTPGPDDRRDYAPSSASGLGSMADQFQSSMELSPGTPIDPSLDRFQALAQVGVEHVVPFEQFHLVGDSVITSNYDFSNVSPTDQSSNFSHGNEGGVIPWNANTMKRQHSSAQQGNRKRARRQFEPGFPSQGPNSPLQLSLSQGGRSPHSRSLQFSPHREPQFPYTVGDAFNPEDSSSFSQSQALDIFSQSSTMEQPTSAPQTMPTSSVRNKAKPKTQRRQDKKYSCLRCGSDKTFSTSNDLDRHLKTVHGIIPDGEKVWLCQIHGCPAAAKVWARLDNFKQHVIRMHGSEYADQAENMSDEYNFARHGAVETGKAKPRATPHQRAASQNVGSIVDDRGSLFGPEPTASSQSHMNVAQELSNFNPRAFAAPRSTINTPRSGNTSMINHAQRSLSTLSAFGTPHVESLSPHDGYHPQRHRMQLQRSGRRTIANPEDVRYSRQYVQDEDANLANLPAFNPSNADFASLGEGMEHAGGAFGGPIDNSAPPLTARQDTVNMERIDLDSSDPTARVIAFQQRLPTEFREEFEHVRRFLSFPHNTLQSRSDTPPETLNETKADGAKAKRFICSWKTFGVNGVEQKCEKSFEKRSELKKHESRHLRKYGCTFDNCYKKFGTKWEWKRHEYTQHLQLEGWRCMQDRCEQHFDSSRTFSSHLEQHKITHPDAVAKELKACHLEKKWMGSYWCGFCNKIIASSAEFGYSMVEERNNHISNHIDGKHSDGKIHDMFDWIELKANGKNKRKMREIHRGASVEPESDGEIHPEVHDDDDSDEDVDAPAEEDLSPPAINQPRIDTGCAQRESHTTGERRRSSVATPAIVVSPANDNNFAPGFNLSTERQTHLQRQRALSDLGPQMYSMSEDQPGYGDAADAIDDMFFHEGFIHE